MYQVVGSNRGRYVKSGGVTMFYVCRLLCRWLLFVKMPLNATYWSYSSQWSMYASATSHWGYVAHRWSLNYRCCQLQTS